MICGGHSRPKYIMKFTKKNRKERFPIASRVGYGSDIVSLHVSTSFALR